MPWIEPLKKSAKQDPAKPYRGSKTRTRKLSTAGRGAHQGRPARDRNPNTAYGR
jgi:hypothetical protein